MTENYPGHYLEKQWILEGVPDWVLREPLQRLQSFKPSSKSGSNSSINSNGSHQGEVLVGKNPDDRFRIQDWLFRGFCVVKYDPWNPDPRSPPIPLNHHHHLIFILFTSNHNIPQSLFAAEENLGNLQVSYITKISLICLNWSKHRANCQYRDHVDGQLNICAEI